MKTTNECVEFENGQVAQAWSVGAMIGAMVVLALVAAFSSGCTRDVYVDPTFEGDVFADNGENDTYQPPMPEGDDTGDEGDAYSEGDCAGPWGCKAYADLATLPPECETSDDCADGFECEDGQCVPVDAEADVTEDSGDAIEHGLYPLEIATQETGESEPECHCGVGYACEDGFCVKVGGNDNPPNNDEEDVSPEPQSDVVTQEDVAPQPTEDVAAEGDANTATSDVTADEGSVGDVATQDAGADAAAEVEADSAEANEIAEAPEVVVDSGVAPEPYDGVVCTITCTADYNKVRVWWAFTSADVENGAEFKIPFVQLCTWGEVAFEYNCFNSATGVWGDYLKAQVKCSPTEYELVDKSPHGKVKFEKSCW